MTVRWRMREMAGGTLLDTGYGHGKMCAWLPYPNEGVCSTHTASSASCPATTSTASLAIRWRGSFLLSGAQKNRLQGLRARAYDVVRPHDTASSRPVVRRHADLPRIRGAASALLLHWQGEARASGLPGRQSALHEAVRPVRRPPLPEQHDQGCRQGTEPALGRRQGTRQAVHACRNWSGLAPRDRRPSASTRYRFARATPTGLSSAT